MIINIVASILVFFDIYFSQIPNGITIVYLLFFIVLLLNIVLTIVFIVKERRIYYLCLFIISVVIVFILGFSGLKAKIIFKYELLKSKYQLENIKKNNREYNNVFYYEPIYLFTFIKTENMWIAYAFNDTNYFENIENSERNEVNAIIIYAKIDINGYNLRTVREIEQNWYSCVFFREE
jgi:hypothetical protein